MKRNFYIGVDGGATKCTIRLEDERGELLGKVTGGAATLRFPAEQVWQTILDTLKPLLQQHNLQLEDDNSHFHIGMGLAGTEITANYNAFINHSHVFKTCIVSSDAHTACLSAHGAKDGAIIIVGTGVIGYQTQQQKITKVGGFGFPHDDEGGGAWLGLQAVKATVQCLDGRAKQSGLSQAVFEHFHHDTEELITWANQANGTRFAQLAPIVIEQSKQHDFAAITLLQKAANEIDAIAKTLQGLQTQSTESLPCALIGSIAPFIQPYLSDALQNRLVTVTNTPDVGALLLVRNANVAK